MNEFDQFVKHRLKVQYYIRYADDFVILSHERVELERLLPLIETFLNERLKLSLHPDPPASRRAGKVFIKTLASGVDFLGWVHFPDHRILRTATKRRMFARLNEYNENSYLGLCKHGNTAKIQALCKTLVAERAAAPAVKPEYENEHSIRDSQASGETPRDH